MRPKIHTGTWIMTGLTVAIAIATICHLVATHIVYRQEPTLAPEHVEFRPLPQWEPIP